MKNLLFVLLLPLLFACNKGDNPTVRYRVQCNGGCEVSYSMNGGLVTTESVSGSWNKSFRGNIGSQIYLTAMVTAPIGSASIEVKLNDEVFDSKATSISFELISISGIIPE